MCYPCWMLRKADGCAAEGYSSMIIAQWKGRGDGGVNISDSPTLYISFSYCSSAEHRRRGELAVVGERAREPQRQPGTVVDSNAKLKVT